MPCCKSNTAYEERKPVTVGPFHAMFKVISFCMATGLIYPNPTNERIRLGLIAFVFLLATPACCMLIYDVSLSWTEGDIPNIIRHTTIIVPFGIVFLKMCLMNLYRNEAKQIMDEINRDHCAFNTLPGHHRCLIDEHLDANKKMEKYWPATMILVISGFPIMAALTTLYEYIVKPYPKKYMVHDLRIPFVPPETRFEEPYFGINFVYMTCASMVMILNFIGYDGFFVIAINHACVKMRLYCKALEDAFSGNGDGEEDILKKTGEVIRAQIAVHSYVDTIQKTFNFWLGVLLIGTVTHICDCMYQIVEGNGLDLRYVVLFWGSIVHVFLPCNYASKLKSTSMETANLIYCSGWENVPSQRVRKTLVFMIARAQRPMEITAFNLLTFDMELFVSILQKSYSMFALLRSGD